MSTITTKKIKVRNRWATVKMESYSCAAEVVRNCKERECRHSDYDMSKRSLDVDFHGVETYDEALELLATGYQPTVDKLKSVLKPSIASKGKRIKFENNIYGFAPVVPLAMKGVPNSMVNMTVKPIKSKVLDIYYDIAVMCHVSTTTIIESGQKMLSVILDLERQGYRINLYAFQGYADGAKDDFDILCVKVKSSDKPLDLKRVSFPLTHPSFFRVIGFDWQGRAPFTKYRGGGRGQAFTQVIDDKEADALVKEMVGKNAFYFSGNTIRTKDEEYIKEVLTK